MQMWQYIVAVSKNLLMRLFTKLWAGLRETTKDAAAPAQLATEKKILIALGWRSNLPDLERLGSARHACMRACLLAQSLSCARLFATLWTVARQAPLSMGLSRQECWSGLPFSPPGDLPDPGVKPASPVSPALQADSLPLSHLGSHCMSNEAVKIETQK